jgi:hypothetical protein
MGLKTVFNKVVYLSVFQTTLEQLQGQTHQLTIGQHKRERLITHCYKLNNVFMILSTMV